MADYTQKNLKDDVENAAEKFGLAPSLEARFGRSALGLEGGGASATSGMRPTSGRPARTGTSGRKRPT